MTTYTITLLLIICMYMCFHFLSFLLKTSHTNMKVRINATGDTIVLKFLRPNADTKLEGYILGYGSSMFSKQFIQLPENGQPYETEFDAEPKYLIAVQPIPVNEVKKQCTGKVELEKPLHLVIGSVTPTSVLLSWGTLLKTPYESNVMNDCLEDGHYTVRYRERSRKWNYQTCPTSDTVIDNLKPNTVYEFGVQPNSKDGDGHWSQPVIHNVSMEGMLSETTSTPKPMPQTHPHLLPHETSQPATIIQSQFNSQPKPRHQPNPQPTPQISFEPQPQPPPLPKQQPPSRTKPQLKTQTQLSPQIQPTPHVTPVIQTQTTKPTPQRTTQTHQALTDTHIQPQHKPQYQSTGQPQTQPQPKSNRRSKPPTPPNLNTVRHSKAQPTPKSKVNDSVPKPKTQHQSKIQPKVRPQSQPKKPPKTHHQHKTKHQPKLPQPQDHLHKIKAPPVSESQPTLPTHLLPKAQPPRFDLGENSSIFRPLPTSDVDVMGKKRFVAPHVIYKTDKKPDEPCSITSSLAYFPDEENNDLNVTGPPRIPPSNVTVVTVEGCPSFVILDWQKSDNETREYEVVSTTKGPNGKEVSVLTTNQTHTAVENLKPESSYEFKVTPKNELGTGPSSDPVSFSTESADPRVSEYVAGKDAIWTQFPFKADAYSECNGKQFVKRTWYRKFVGIQLCNSLRYKIYLSDTLNGKFYNIGDQTGHGEDHCQFVDSFLDGRTGTQMFADQLPSRSGYFRALRQEPVHFGEIGGKSHITYVGWYECGTPIPGKW
uniref:ABI family member 3 binding protein n=1 Tax=Sphaeramia orbicularis TaxID=375764 RepID=A0A673CXP7_9TELE